MAKKETNVAEETVETTVAENPELDGLKLELENAKKQADEYKDKWMRSVAEFDNYKKRNAKIWSDAFGEGRADVLLKILPIGDNLDMALTMELDEKTLDGLKLIRRKYDEVLESMEVTEINPVGEPFNYETSEAIMTAEAGEGETPDTVKQVFQKGYKLKDKIIRYAKVSVIK